MKVLKFVLSGMAVALWWSVAFADPVIFSHPYDPNSTNAYTSWWEDETGPSHQCFADYYWDGANAITDFHWWGVPQDATAQVVTAFTFEIWSNNASDNKPGSLLYSELIAGNAGQTFVGTNASYWLDVYYYSLDLATPFQPASQDYYWFSVAAHGGYWYWALDNGTVFNFDWQHEDMREAPEDNWRHAWGGDYADFAFEITGSSTTIPEPATLMLLGSGLLGMGGISAFRFRRKK